MNACVSVLLASDVILVLVGLTTVDKLEVFYIDFCCFSNQKVLFLAINDAMASSPEESAAIDS